MAQPVLTDITRIEFDPEFSPGAYNAVNTCLRIQPAEKVTLITDNACREIAASIAQELIKVGCPFKAFVLEDLAPRPLTGLPREIAEDMETSDVSIFAVRVQTQRTEVAHGDDRHRQPPAHAPCAHGQHQPPDHAGRHARRLQPCRRPEQQSDARSSALPRRSPARPPRAATSPPR